MQALAMTVAEIPVFVYTTFGQVQGVGKVFLGGCLCEMEARWGGAGGLQELQGEFGVVKRVVLSGLREERKVLPTSLPRRTPRFNLSLHQRR